MPSALSVVRPAGVAVLLLAAVAVTAGVLYAYWPAGIAVGLALGTGAVLAIGARMQHTERLQPADVELAAELGIAPAFSAPRTAPAAPVAPAPTEQPEALEPVLHAQPDVLYFTSDDDPDSVEARDVVAAPITTEVAIVEPEHVEPEHVEPEQVEAMQVQAVQVEAEHAEAVHVGSEQVESEHVDPVRGDLEQLKVELGADYRDFARAAHLVVSTQYASAARLQRDLDLPYSRARRLLADLEQQHFVGPATGSLPRQVLLPKERLPEVEQLLAEV